MLNSKDQIKQTVAVEDEQFEGAALRRPSSKIMKSLEQSSELDESWIARLVHRHGGVVNIIKTNLKTAALLLFPCLLLLVFLTGFNSHTISSEFQNSQSILQKIKSSSNGKLQLAKVNGKNPSTGISGYDKFIQLSLKTDLLKTVEDSLKKQRYLEKRKYPFDPILPGETQQPLQKLSLNTLINRARSELINPEYPEYFGQILINQPYNNLPFCLVTKLLNSQQKSLNTEIVKSIFSLKYLNYITIFISDQGQGLSESQLQKLEKQTLKGNPIKYRMYFRLNYPNPNYYDYRYILQQLCVQNSYIMFVSAPLKPNALNTLNGHHQNFPIYLTLSTTPEYTHVNSFAMRLFELLGINDFRGANKKYLKMAGQENFYALGLLELGAKFARLFPVTDVSVETPRAKGWMTGVLQADAAVYERDKYQYILKLSQSYKINLEQHIRIQNSSKAGNKEYLPRQSTQLTTIKLSRALEYQQCLFLPSDHALNRRQQIQINKTYGIAKRQERSTPVTLPERPICAVVIGGGNGEGGKHGAYWSQRYLNNIQGLIRQNYDNFHIVYINNGMQEQEFALINGKVEEKQFPSDRLEVIWYREPKSPLFSVIKAVHEKCKDNEMVTILDNDFELIGPQFMNTVNFVTKYNPNIWLLNTNFKSDGYKFGASYRINSDNEYIHFGTRVKNLSYLTPLIISQSRLLRAIPITHLADETGKWFQIYWHKALQHALTQLATVAHIEYISEISFDCSEQYFNNFYQSGLGEHQQLKEQMWQEEEYEDIGSLPPLKPIRFLNNHNEYTEQKLRKKLEQIN